MEENQFTYAVARIRAIELSLFSKQNLEMLLSFKSYEDSIKYLLENGWGESESDSAEKILINEREKTWKLMRELVDKESMSIFDVFLIANDFHNLKAAIKQAYVNKENPNIFMSMGTIDVEKIVEATNNHDFSMLPKTMSYAANEAYEVQFRTGDSQLTDTIIDKACLEAVYEKGKESNNDLIKAYAELKCASSNINIAVRASKTNKGIDFLERAFAKCDTLNEKRLIESTLNSKEALYEYLESTIYSDAVEFIKESTSAFEKWCDNRLMEMIKPQKYNSFTVSPLLAYVLAKENEIKSVRIILSGILNDLSEESVRERLRDMYV